MRSILAQHDARIAKLFLFRRATTRGMVQALAFDGVKTSKDSVARYVQANKSRWIAHAEELWDRAERRGSGVKALAVSPRERGNRGDLDTEDERKKARSYFKNEMRFGVAADEDY